MSDIKYPLNLTETLRRDRFYLRTQPNEVKQPPDIDPPLPDISAPYVQQLVFGDAIESGQDSVTYMSITIKKYGSDSETTLAFNSSGPYGTTADIEIDGKLVRIRATGGSGTLAWINAFVDDSKDMLFEFKITVLSSADFYIVGQDNGYNTVPINPTFSMSSAGITFKLKAKATKVLTLNPSMASEVHYIPIYRPSPVDDVTVVVKQLKSLMCPYLTIQLDNSSEVLRLENIETALAGIGRSDATISKYMLNHSDGLRYTVEQTIVYSHAKFVVYITDDSGDYIIGETVKITLPYQPTGITYDKILDTYWQSESTADNTVLNVGFDYIAFYIKSSDNDVDDAAFTIYKDPNITDPLPSTALVRHYIPTYRQETRSRWIVDNSNEFGGYWEEYIVYSDNNEVYFNITIKLVYRNIEFYIDDFQFYLRQGESIQTMENEEFSCTLKMVYANSHLRFTVSLFNKTTNNVENNELVQIILSGPDLDGLSKAYWIPDLLPYQLESNMSNTSFRNGLEFIMFYLLSTDTNVGDTTFKSGDMSNTGFTGGDSAMVSSIELIDIYTS